MIGYLRGELKKMDGAKAIVDVNGVGYEVNVASMDKLIGEEVELDIITVVRETEISLWGFRTTAEKALFQMLIGVSGVGARTAMQLLAEKGISQVVSAIHAESAADLKATGVGKKTAERILIDLKGKIDEIGVLPDTDSIKQSVSKERKSEFAEVVNALESLGYYKPEIEKLLSEMDNEIIDSLSTEELIRHVIKSI